MAVINPAQIPDLVTNVQESLWMQKKWNDISETLQYKTFADRFFRGKKLNTRSGDVLQWSVQVAGQDNHVWRGLFQETNLGIPGALQKNASTNWSICQDGYAFDELEPVFMSDDIRVIVDHIRVREHAMYENWYKKLEVAFWTAPAAPGDANTPNPLCGIPFWVQAHATEGFNGGDPSGWSAGAGNLLSATYPGWKNYTGTYSSVNNRDDFIARLRKADRRTKFIPAHSYASSTPEERQFVRYSTEYVVEGLAKYLDGRADNIRDPSGTQGLGDGVFNSAPVQWVPCLDTDSTLDSYVTNDPIFSIDWNTMQLVFQAGRELTRMPPIRRPGYNTVWDVFVLSMLQLFTTDRRRHSRLYRS